MAPRYLWRIHFGLLLLLCYVLHWGVLSAQHRIWRYLSCTVLWGITDGDHSSGGGFNRQYLIAFVGLTLISSIYSFFTYVDMGSRDAASAILNHRASTA